MLFVLGTMSEKTLFEKLIENWGNVKRNVKLAEVVDPLIQKGIVSLELWADLRNNYQSEIDRMEEFMLKIFNKDNPEAIEIFVEALRKNGYISTANSISGRSGKYNLIYYYMYLKIYIKVEKREILNALKVLADIYFFFIRQSM